MTQDTCPNSNFTQQIGFENFMRASASIEIFVDPARIHISIETNFSLRVPGARTHIHAGNFRIKRFTGRDIPRVQ